MPAYNSFKQILHEAGKKKVSFDPDFLDLEHPEEGDITAVKKFLQSKKVLVTKDDGESRMMEGGVSDVSTSGFGPNRTWTIRFTGPGWPPGCLTYLRWILCSEGRKFLGRSALHTDWVKT